MMDAEDSFIDFADVNRDNHQEGLKERQEGLRQFRTNAEDAIEGLEAFYYETTQLKGINRELNRAINEVSTPLSDLISTITKSDARAERMIQLIEQKLSIQ